MRKGVELRLFLTFILFSFYFVQWYGWNEESNFALTRAIVDENRFEIDTWYNQTGDRAFYDGHYYSDKDPGLSFLASPVYAGWKLMYGLFPTGFKERYGGGNEYIVQVFGDAPVVTIINRGFFVFMCMILLTVFTSGVLTALTSLLVFKLSGYFIKRRGYRILLALTYFFGTLAFPSSLHFMNHSASTFFSFLSFFLLFRSESIRTSLKYFSLSGLSLGLSILLDRLCLIFLPFYSMYALSINRKLFFVFLSSAFLSLLPYLIYNFMIFKDPFMLCSSYVDENIFKQAYHLGHDSLGIVKSSIIDVQPLVRRLHLIALSPNPNVILRILFYPYRGLFFYHPVLLLSLIGLYYMLDDHEGKAFMIISILFFFSFFISMRKVWWGGYCFGERYMLPVVPLLMLPLFYSLKKLGLKIFLAFLILSVFINIIGLQPAEEYAYDWERMDVKEEWIKAQDGYGIIFNPLLEHYLPLFLKHGPRSGIFENLINGYGSIDIRFPASSKGKNFPFSAFHVPFLCLVPPAVLLLMIWKGYKQPRSKSIYHGV